MTTRRALAAWILVVLAAAPAAPTEPERTAADELRSVAEVRSLIVVRGGSTALEWYRTPADAGPTNIKSASKSVLSALVGIALDRGLIADLDTPVVELLPAHADLLEAPAKRGITLRHLLSMTAGLESTSREAYGAWVSGDHWLRGALSRRMVSEPGEDFVYSTGSSHTVAAILDRAPAPPGLESTSREAYGAWVSGDHWLRGALSRPMVSEPGEDFVYSTGSSHAVAAILDRATSPPGLVRWAREVIFGPAGIGPVTWQRAPEGVPFGGNNMSMTPRDLARFGRLWLVGDGAEADRVVPARWVKTATRRHAEGWPERYGAYGLGWWLPGGGPFLAVGYGGQFLWVDPEHDSVVVVTSTDSGKDAAWDRRVLDLVRRLGAGG